MGGWSSVATWVPQTFYLDTSCGQTIATCWGWYLPSMYIDLVLTTAIDLVFDIVTILVVVSAFTGYGNMCNEHWHVAAMQCHITSMENLTKATEWKEGFLPWHTCNTSGKSVPNAPTIKQQLLKVCGKTRVVSHIHMDYGTDFRLHFPSNKKTKSESGER